MVDQKGDIQEREAVAPADDSMYGLIKDIVEQRGEAHIYLPNHRDQAGAHDDIHLEQDKVYFFDEHQLIFVQDDNGAEEVQRWIEPEWAMYVESHA